MRTLKSYVPTAVKDAVKRPFQPIWRRWQTRAFRCDSLLILDDYFPNLLSAFRIAEYNAYLAEFPGARVLSSCQAEAGPSNRGPQSFEEHLQDYRRVFPQFADRIHFNDNRWRPSAPFAYTIFLNQAYWNLELLERARIPFAFTLYPGAGMRIDCPESNRQLRRVFASPQFRGVITTQNVTRDYLLQHQFCPAEAIRHIYGAILPLDRLAKVAVQRDDRPRNLCFVASKYTADGSDKGFDLFLEAGRLLLARFPDLRLHVVGGFSTDDCADPQLRERITFYGFQPTEFFPEFYRKMQVILSPNRAFRMLPGAYDGFPTGCCMEAALCGVGVFCSDPLNMNETFADGRELVVIPLDAQQIAATVAEFLQDADRLYRLRTAGQARFWDVLSWESQMVPRLELLRQFL